MTIPTHLGRDLDVLENMGRRIAIVLLLVVSILTNVSWTGQVWAQTDVRRIGILSFLADADDPTWEQWMAIIRRELADQGWIEGKNISFEFRNAQSDPSQFSEAAASLVGLDVDVILADSAPSLRAAYAATQTIPIAAIDLTTDPVAEGYVQSYGRPGGNVTGVFLDAPEFAGKWFELLKAMIPNLSRVAVLWDPGPGATHVQAVRSVAESLDIQPLIFEAQTPGDIVKAFASLDGRAQAVVILPSPMMFGQSNRLAELALQNQLPATSMSLDFAYAGGLIAYGPEPKLTTESVAVLVAKILAGARAGDVPIERPLKIQLAVNLKTAKALGITIPQSILLRADEVIR